MRLPKKSLSGVTIIELVIGISILAGLASIGLFIAMNQYSSYVLEADWNAAASLLQTARARAMSNINSSAHGLYFDAADFVVFQGSSYDDRDTAYDEKFVRSAIVTVTGPEEIVFNRLRGDLLEGNGTVTLSNGERSRTITLNNEGQISW